MFCIRKAGCRHLLKSRKVCRRNLFTFWKRSEKKMSSDKDMVVGDSKSEVKISIDEESTSISTEVKEGIKNDTQDTIHAINEGTEEGSRLGEITLLTTGFGLGFGLLYHKYFNVNDAETIRFWYHHPFASNILHSCRILPSNLIEKYDHYDYQLYIARLAAAILNDPSHRITSISGFVAFLNDWMDLSSIEIDETVDFNHSSILSILSSIRSLPNYYTIYILGERVYQVSPITSSIQSEINTFYNFAKEDESIISSIKQAIEGKRGVHRLYVLSILRNIQHHTHSVLYTPTNVEQSLWAPLRLGRDSHKDQTSLVELIENEEDDHLSLIQLTNILACVNRQIQSDTLLIYRLRLAAKKVDDDRKYEEEIRHLDEIRLTELLPKIPRLNKEVPQKSVEEVLEEEIVKNTKPIEVVVNKVKEEEEEPWW